MTYNMKKNKNLFSQENLRKIKHRTEYKINESPRYRSLINDDEEFDNIPDANIGNHVGHGANFNTMVGEQEGDEGETSNISTSPKKAKPESGEDMLEPPMPAYAENEKNTPSAEAGINEPTSQPDVDVIQNEIIRHNIEAMKSIQMELENLNNTVNGLNTKLATLNADVEEVREPTNAEKLMKKTSVSYPYYFNLNDFWNDNWFAKKRDDAREKGIRELPDGTYIADFDDLPKDSKTDIQRSFNSLI